MAPSGNLGIDHDRGPLPAPSEPYGAFTTLGFTLHPILQELISVSARVGPYFRPFLKSI